MPGVERVALAGWSLLSGNGWNDSVSVDGGPPSEDLAYFLSVSPGWADVMKIPFIDGLDFRPSDTYPGFAIVNDTFAKRYFRGANPIGRTFDQVEDEGGRQRFQIVGVIRDARYRGVREAIPPLVYVPFRALDKKGAPRAIGRGTFIVRTSGSNPLALVSVLRREIPRARPGFRVSNIRTQREINEVLTVRERLLAMLAVFFAAVALLLAGIGLHGVLDYSVLQRRREIGIRIAIGAQATDIARRVIMDALAVVLAGSIFGIILGIASVRFIESLLFEVKATDVGALALPTVTILAVALPAALPAMIRAVRIDPVTMLRSE